MSDGKKLPRRLVLCLTCMVKLDDGFDLEEASPARFEKCEECGKKSVVKDYIIRRKNKNAVR